MWGFPPSLAARKAHGPLPVSFPALRCIQVGMIAVNDGSLLNSHIFAILRRHLRSHASYLPLLELFLEVRVPSVGRCPRV